MNLMDRDTLREPCEGINHTILIIIENGMASWQEVHHHVLEVWLEDINDALPDDLSCHTQ